MITHEMLVRDLVCHDVSVYECAKFDSCEDCREHVVTEYEEHIRAEAQEKTIDEIIKTLSKSEDTILSDKQFYALIELKEQMKGGENE